MSQNLKEVREGPRGVSGGREFQREEAVSSLLEGCGAWSGEEWVRGRGRT